MSLAGDIGLVWLVLLDGRKVALSSLWISSLTGVIFPYPCVRFIFEVLLLNKTLAKLCPSFVNPSVIQF